MQLHEPWTPVYDTVTRRLVEQAAACRPRLALDGILLEHTETIEFGGLTSDDLDFLLTHFASVLLHNVRVEDPNMLSNDVADKNARTMKCKRLQLKGGWYITSLQMNRASIRSLELEKTTITLPEVFETSALQELRCSAEFQNVI